MQNQNGKLNCNQRKCLKMKLKCEIKLHNQIATKENVWKWNSNVKLNCKIKLQLKKMFENEMKLQNQIATKVKVI